MDISIFLQTINLTQILGITFIELKRKELKKIGKRKNFTKLVSLRLELNRKKKKKDI